MPITERTLRNWRRDALCGQNLVLTLEDHKMNELLLIETLKRVNERVIRLTAELLDQYLMRPRR